MVYHVPICLLKRLNTNKSQLDRLVGLSMLIAATAIFLYYTIWTLLMVCPPLSPPIPSSTKSTTASSNINITPI